MNVNMKPISNHFAKYGPLEIALGLGLGFGFLYFSESRPKPESNEDAQKTDAEAKGSSPNRFDVDSRDPEGYDKQGYDAEGFHRNGYNREGFNRDGLDFEGFGKNKYNPQGLDRAGKDAHYYISYFWKLYNLKEEAFNQMEAGEFTYALLDVRLVLEQSVSLVICHVLGPNALSDTLDQNLKICEKHHLFGDDPDFISRLHGVRRICNSNLHTLDGTETVTINQVFFAVAQVRDLIPIARDAVAA